MDSKVTHDTGTLTLRRLQAENREWVAVNFPNQKAWHALLGVAEEVGEAAHSYLKMDQGIRGSKEEHLAKLRDSVGDIVIILANFCTEMGFDLQEVVGETWAEVKTRDWKNYPNNGGVCNEVALTPNASDYSIHR